MQHSEQLAEAQNLVLPGSPNRHSRRVPCQRRFSLPADLPVATKWPRASTAALRSTHQNPELKNKAGQQTDKHRSWPAKSLFQESYTISSRWAQLSRDAAKTT